MERDRSRPVILYPGYSEDSDGQTCFPTKEGHEKRIPEKPFSPLSSPVHPKGVSLPKGS